MTKLQITVYPSMIKCSLVVMLRWLEAHIITLVSKKLSLKSQRKLQISETSSDLPKEQYGEEQPLQMRMKAKITSNQLGWEEQTLVNSRNIMVCLSTYTEASTTSRMTQSLNLLNMNGSKRAVSSFTVSRLKNHGQTGELALQTMMT